MKAIGRQVGADQKALCTADISATCLTFAASVFGKEVELQSLHGGLEWWAFKLLAQIIFRETKGGTGTRSGL